MRTVVDTTVLISHLRGDRRATDFLLGMPREDRLASVLTRVEIEGGMRTGERREVATLFATIQLIEVTDLIARRAAFHLRRLRRSHGAIDLVDYVIAATAELHDAALATLNVKHFPMFKGLQAPW